MHWINSTTLVSSVQSCSGALLIKVDHSFRADKEMAGRGGQVRKHEESGETPIKQKKPMSSRPTVSPSTTSGAAMAELRSMLIEVKNGQNRLCENLDK